MPSDLCPKLFRRLQKLFFGIGHLCSYFYCTLHCSTVFLFECFTNNVRLIDAAPQRALLIKYDSARWLCWTLLLPTNLPREGSSKGSLLSLKSFLLFPPQCVVFPTFRKTKQNKKKKMSWWLSRVSQRGHCLWTDCQLSITGFPGISNVIRRDSALLFWCFLCSVLQRAVESRREAGQGHAAWHSGIWFVFIFVL